jgi:hemophore-related protein
LAPTQSVAARHAARQTGSDLHELPDSALEAASFGNARYLYTGTAQFRVGIIFVGGMGFHMVESVKTMGLVAAGFVALSLTAGTGLASAAPDAQTLSYTKCSYNQVVNAVNAEVPEEASGINSSSQLQGMLRDLLAAPQPERLSMIQQAQGNFFVSDDIGAMIQVADTCGKY